ncbi:uncharacterized protein LOC120089410 [Benincasa hispida]|uniref:uncharacterized protein LOC120089410 n=1 Tax=Benincasa hispida TaxID=102211 RepID=UPI0019000D06|nr:uncharacterized protein LOC120089410 [Benincasa hispida]
MEHNVEVISKRIWNMVRIAYYMLRKGISKSKLMVDLTNLISKRRKLTGKALKNLIFHHGHDGISGGAFSLAPFRRNQHLDLTAAAGHYEFSCTNTPAFPSFHYAFNKRRHFFACAHPPNTLDDDVAAVNAFKAVWEALNNNNDVAVGVASPSLPGFGRSPMLVRQLRVTDSPFPLAGGDDEDCHVDKAAEEFINRFYKELRLQKTAE